MEPRLKTSKKWTTFPAEYLEQIQSVFNENFAQFLDQGSVLVEGRIYPEEILFQAGYLEKGRLKQVNFEVSVGYTQDEGHALSQIHRCVDAAASMLLEFLEEEKTSSDYPLSWKEVNFDNGSIFVRLTTENSALEKEADRLLGLANDEIVQEGGSDEDALERAEIDPEISPDPEDWEQDQDEEVPPSNKRRLH